MSNRKQIGSYYTPSNLSKFIMRYVAPYFAGREKMSIFEPSIGDGSFVTAFNEGSFNVGRFSFTGIDKIEFELDKAKVAAKRNKKKQCSYKFHTGDFLEFQKKLNNKFSLIAGNPPYIKKQLLSDKQIQLCNEIHRSENLSVTSIKNIWPAFLIRASQLLETDGVLAFVLPSELLQVNFTTELRELLTDKFERTEIFTFDDLLFECKGQDTVLLIAYKKHSVPGQYYAHVKDTAQLEKNDFVLNANNALVNTQTKWCHHLVSEADLVFFKSLTARVRPIDYYCDSKPGIVTAANGFFIVNEQTESRHNLSAFTRPILQKALFVNGSVVFTKVDYQNLLKEGKPAKIIVIADEDEPLFDESVSAYLKQGETMDLQSGHKCSKRKNWFVIPNISTSPDGFFFRRSHHYPKLIKNEANVLVTDTAYKVNIKPGFDINSLIYSFYNSFSLAVAELEGRSYGGGVLEIMPSEFKKIPVPYIDIDQNTFEVFRRRFEQKTNITEVLELNDEQLLRTSMNLTTEEVKRVQKIYKALYNKRFRISDNH